MQPELHSQNYAPNHQRAETTTALAMSLAAMVNPIIAKVGGHGYHSGSSEAEGIKDDDKDVK